VAALLTLRRDSGELGMSLYARRPQATLATDCGTTPKLLGFQSVTSQS